MDKNSLQQNNLSQGHILQATKAGEKFPLINASPSTDNKQLDQAIKHPKGPGIFFDLQKGKQYQKLEQAKKKVMLRGSSSKIFFARKRSDIQKEELRNQGDILAAATLIAQGSNGVSSSGQKLYSPYEYLHYATKLNFSKESYINALSQLGYTHLTQLHEQPYNQLMTKTQSLLKHSYSLKYLGVIDGNMGILSKRLEIKSTDNKQKQIKHPQKKKQKPQEKQQLLKSNLPNISVVPPQSRSDLYNSYLITKYSLPKYLKPIQKEKDSSILEDKLRLEQWHAEQLRSERNAHIFHTQLPNSHSQNASETTLPTQIEISLAQTGFTGKLKPKKQNNIRIPLSSATFYNPSQQTSSLDMQPIDPLFFQAPEQEQPQTDALSYSRLINSLENQQPVLLTPNDQPKAVSSNILSKQSHKIYPHPILSLQFTQNQQLQDRYDHIANLLHLKNYNHPNNPIVSNLVSDQSDSHC